MANTDGILSIVHTASSTVSTNRHGAALLTFHEEVFLDVAVTEEGGHDGVRRDADEEDEHDAEQHQRDAVPTRQLLACNVQQR